jgi:hypothetical protein
LLFNGSSRKLPKVKNLNLQNKEYLNMLKTGGQFKKYRLRIRD